MAGALLYCPIRGHLTAQELAKDGLTTTEEARRIDFLHFLLDERGYPAENIAVETVVLSGLGSEGRNTLRADVIVYDAPVKTYTKTKLAERVRRVVLVAEIKREQSGKRKGVTNQLEPALLILPNVRTLGVYWDDQNHDLFIKELVATPTQHIEIRTDTIANLPVWGQEYRTKPITIENLTQPANLVATLFNLANIMRSHGVNDELVRYRETIKLLLARYVDERQARSRRGGAVNLQVFPGLDPTFLDRVQKVYADSAARYSQAETLFHPVAGSELDERVLRPLVASIQGFDLSSASNDTMQQVFMSFVPVVFKKALSQYFTPISLINAVVAMVSIGPTDKVVDPAMGTADFLTAAMAASEDDDISQRVFGIDSDHKAFDLAVVNMILNRDGQSGLVREDSIRNPSRWTEQMNVALCNPPFGSQTIEDHSEVLAHYDLGHVWERVDDRWSMTDKLLPHQQLGILFLERCWKMLRPGGRMGIIMPEGYLSTGAYTYVRQWVLDHFRIVALIELPRRIFTKSDADLRSNILVATKLGPKDRPGDYPIYASLVRKVGYKLGGDFAPMVKRDEETGLELRDDQNRVILDSDFSRTLDEYSTFRRIPARQWEGGHLSDIVGRPDLDMKPRRLVPRALRNMRRLTNGEYVRLSDIAEVVEDTIDLLSVEIGAAAFRRPVEGANIRAVEGIVSPAFPERCWLIAQRKHRRVYELRRGDVIVGLVRPERRNVGVLLEWGYDIVGIRDALAVVRVKQEFADEYPQEWLFSALRSEQCRVQFWTEAGGTSYGKLDLDQVRNLVLASTSAQRLAVAVAARKWMDAVEAMHEFWTNVGTEDDRRPILNSPLTGLIGDDEEGEPTSMRSSRT